MSVTTEVSPDEQAFAFGDVELVAVVGDPVLESGVVDADLCTAAGQVEVKEVPTFEEGSGAHNQVASERAPVDPRPAQAHGSRSVSAQRSAEPPLAPACHRRTGADETPQDSTAGRADRLNALEINKHFACARSSSPLGYADPVTYG